MAGNYMVGFAFFKTLSFDYTWREGTFNQKFAIIIESTSSAHLSMIHSAI